MCGRFVRTSDTQAILREFDADGGGLDIPPSYNIAPSQVVAVIVNDDRKRLLLCRWGFVPHWAKDVSKAAINARAETVAVNRAFSAAFKSHRCLVVADGFYEWRQSPNGKTPVFIRLKSSTTPFGFAGLYSTLTTGEGGVIHTCTIITTQANALIAKIHDRMPVIIHKDNYDLWLGPNADGLSALLIPYPDGEMEAHDVSTMVNSPKNNSPLCLTMGNR
ncbi:MAG: SOS response-associated peptidase [Nitrospirae bacterium]|nr:SOS response-associated peptidase [Nitrospirota bacterium]